MDAKSLPVRIRLLGDKELLVVNGLFFMFEGGLMNSAGGTMWPWSGVTAVGLGLGGYR